MSQVVGEEPPQANVHQGRKGRECFQLHITNELTLKEDKKLMCVINFKKTETELEYFVLIRPMLFTEAIYTWLYKELIYQFEPTSSC